MTGVSLQYLYDLFSRINTLHLKLIKFSGQVFANTVKIGRNYEQRLPCRRTALACRWQPRGPGLAPHAVTPRTRLSSHAWRHTERRAREADPVRNLKEIARKWAVRRDDGTVRIEQRLVGRIGVGKREGKRSGKNGHGRPSQPPTPPALQAYPSPLPMPLRFIWHSFYFCQNIYEWNERYGKQDFTFLLFYTRKLSYSHLGEFRNIYYNCY